MLPKQDIDLLVDYTEKEQPSRTYRLVMETMRVSGQTDGLEAIKQAIFKILSTERYQHIIYSWNYGVELADLWGRPTSYVLPELKRRITEALTWDDRIEAVDGFEFDVKGDTIHVSFTAHTVAGTIESEWSVTS